MRIGGIEKKKKRRKKGEKRGKISDGILSDRVNKCLDENSALSKYDVCVCRACLLVLHKCVCVCLCGCVAVCVCVCVRAYCSTVTKP